MIVDSTQFYCNILRINITLETVWCGIIFVQLNENVTFIGVCFSINYSEIEQYTLLYSVTLLLNSTGRSMVAKPILFLL